MMSWALYCGVHVWTHTAPVAWKTLLQLLGGAPPAPVFEWQQEAAAELAVEQEKQAKEAEKVAKLEKKAADKAARLALKAAEKEQRRLRLLAEKVSTYL